MGLRRNRMSAGASLPNRLLIVLVVPLLSVAVATAGHISSQLHTAGQAEQLQRLVADVSVVDAVRRGIEGEVVPSIVTEAVRVAAAAPTGSPAALPASTLKLMRRVASDRGGMRTLTDRAFAAAASAVSDRALTAQLAHARRDLLTARSGGTGDASPSASYGNWATLLTEMADIQSSLVGRAEAAGLGGSTSQTLGDVALITRAAQYAGQLTPSLVATFLPGSTAVRAANRARFLVGWGSYVTASAQVASHAAPPLRAAWVAAERTPASLVVDRGMLSAAVSPQPNNSALGPIGKAASSRQLGFNAVLATSLRLTNAAGDRVRANAQRSFAIVVGLDLLLLIVTLALALLVRVWVTRSLSKLADQARQVSEGELPDVEIGGPREVRTVARALTDAVTTLRGVQAQAGAVADGDLHSAALKTVLPGSLGRVVQASVTRAFDAISDREVAQRELAHQAAHDPLTDLPNRGCAIRAISRSLHRAQRSNAMTGLMFIDLDHFKVVNDTFGHAAGDNVLKTVARRMTAVVREGDLVARLGGDEFVVLLEDVTSETDFVDLANRLVAELSEPIEVDGRQVRVGASVGVAICRDGHVDGDRLMGEADAAGYRAKFGGRGRVDIFDDELRRQLTDHAELEAALFTALARKEFVVFYQPVVDLNTGSATGLEALIRWDRPGFGLVSPMDFIPVAESSTLINEIGRFMLFEATRQLAVWTEEEPATAHLTMAVNISGRHLSSPELIDDVREALTRSGVAADRLIVELTETMLVDDARSTANMQALREFGVRIALDDFGTGYTSIGQLPKLPIDTLKIDRSFVSSADPSRQELCELMVSAARAFGLSVVAEGVETEGQADLLRRLHVQNCQGFLYATPQPADALDPGALVRGQLAPDGYLGRLPLPTA